MAVGARDYIDKLLVKKYADEKVDNHEAMESMVNPEKMLEAMNDVAMIQKNMFMLSQKLCATCYGINAKARYKEKPQAAEG
jgi:hypothetical protein